VRQLTHNNGVTPLDAGHTRLFRHPSNAFTKNQRSVDMHQLQWHH
jgi:hypothetical protein